MTAEEALIGAWVAWEDQPRSQITTDRKMDLLHQLGIDPILAHNTIATWRTHGYDVPSACQALINDHYPHLAHTDLPEAS